MKAGRKNLQSLSFSNPVSGKQKANRKHSTRKHSVFSGEIVFPENRIAKS